MFDILKNEELCDQLRQNPQKSAGNDIFSLPFLPRIVKKEDSRGNEDEGYRDIYRRGSARAGEKKNREDRAEDGGRKREDADARHGVELKKKSPKGVGDSRKECEVDKERDPSAARERDLTAERKAENYHKRTANDKLISAYNDGVLVLREALHKHRGECVGHGGEDNEAVTEEIHSKGKTREVYLDNSRKAKDAGKYLLCGKLLLLKNKACDKHAEERGRARGDSALNARGVCKSDIEEYVLYHRLKGADGEDARNIFLLGEEEFSPRKAVDHNSDNARHKEAHARKKYGRGNARDQKELIAYLDSGRGAAPERTAKERREYKHVGLCKYTRFFVFDFHFFSFLFRFCRGAGQPLYS